MNHGATFPCGGWECSKGSGCGSHRCGRAIHQQPLAGAIAPRGSVLPRTSTCHFPHQGRWIPVHEVPGQDCIRVGFGRLVYHRNPFYTFLFRAFFCRHENWKGEARTKLLAFEREAALMRKQMGRVQAVTKYITSGVPRSMSISNQYI